MCLREIQNKILNPKILISNNVLLIIYLNICIYKTFIIFFLSEKEQTDRSKQRSPTPEDGRTSPKNKASHQETIPPRRFISSILGGDVPYGSRGHVLTRAERKEYSPITPPEKLVLPATKKPSDTPSPNVTPVRCSVIQRTPKTTKRDEDAEQRIPEPIIVQEPEQEQPIDYHIPKRRGETEDENEERKCREQRRSHSAKITKPLISVSNDKLLNTTIYIRIKSVLIYLYFRRFEALWVNYL